MALQKEIATQYGVNANYFKVVTVALNTLINKASITLVGYYNKDAREGDSKSLFVKEYNIKEDEYPSYFDTDILDQENKNVVSMSYQYIKDTDEKFSDAIDV